MASSVLKSRKGAGILVSLTVCCICCFLPGLILIIMTNASYGHWPAVPGKILSTTYCGTSRRRKLGDRYKRFDEDEGDVSLLIPSLNVKESDPSKNKELAYKLPRLESRSTRYQSFSAKQATVDEEEESSDDSDDEESDSEGEAHVRTAQTTYHASFSSYTSHKLIANRKGVSRRRDLQERLNIQRRTKGSSGGGGGGYFAAGAAGGYYAGSHYRSGSYYHRRGSSSDGPSYAITYNFLTNDRQNITATTDYCTNPAPPVGGTEMVLYNPASPSEGLISEGYYEAQHYGGVTMTVIGLISIAVVGLCLFVLFQSMKGSGGDTTTTYGNNYNNGYSDNPHDSVEKPYQSEPPSSAFQPSSYGAPPPAQAQPVNDGPITYTSAAYKPP